MDHSLPELQYQHQAEPQAASGPSSLPHSITAPPQAHQPDSIPRSPIRVPSDESVREDILSPFDHKDNPYDAASAIHGPTRPMSRRRTADTHASRALDWIVPHDMGEKRGSKRLTVYDRLKPTIDHAKEHLAKFNRKAVITGMALNIAIGLQVLLGALTTALAAATSGKQTSIAISCLGGLSTMVASYLARARGSNEPETSLSRCRNLEQFIREAEAFSLDFGHVLGNEHDQRLMKFREHLEEILGNVNGNTKLAEP